MKLPDFKMCIRDRYKKKEASCRKPAVLVSACLLGVNCRYNGGGELAQPVFALKEDAHLIPVCPEIMGGLKTPREPAERTGACLLYTS